MVNTKALIVFNVSDSVMSPEERILEAGVTTGHFTDYMTPQK